MFTGVLIGLALAVAFYFVRSELDFAPFRARVVLTRAGLVENGLATAAQLDALTNVPETSALLRGISFSVLRVGLLSQQGTLIYWNDAHSFSTDLETNVEFSDLPAAASDILRRAGRETVCPWLYIDQTAEGLEIGLIRPDNIEEERQALAILPFAVFGVKQWRTGRMSQKKLAASLKARGWERDEREYGFSAPDVLRHKHVTVKWNYL